MLTNDQKNKCLELSDKVFYKYFGNDGMTTFVDIIKKLYEPHRYFHNADHIYDIINKFIANYIIDNFSESEIDVLVLTAWYHDVVYNPKSVENEIASKEYFLNDLKKATFLDRIVFNEVAQIILDTETHKSDSKLGKIFCELDMSGIYESDISTEYLIFKEYQFYPFKKFKEGRLKFLHEANAHPDRIKWVENFRPKIGIYPGSFNPFHVGHYNIFQKAEKVFDKIIILKAINTSKTEKSLDYTNIILPLPYNQIDTLEEGKFLTDYFYEVELGNEADYFLIRGLRNGDDLTYEENQLFFLKDLKKNLKTVFFMCDEEFKYISSSAIRNIAKINYQHATKYLVNEGQKNTNNSF